MNEIRKHYFLDRWVIISSERSKRPEQFEIKEINIQKGDCPLCPGHIETPIVHTHGDPWRIAVIRNKFPALSPDAALSSNKSFMSSVGGFGYHEVVIEHSDHHQRLENYSQEHIKALLDVYASRTKNFMSDDRIEYVSVFRNEGASAGASIAHPHSQIMALPVVPRLVERERGKTEEMTHLYGECPFEKIYDEEREGPRALIENDSFFALAPFASIYVGETWVVPKRHVRTLFELRDDERQRLAEILLKTIGRLKSLFPGLPYNMAVHQAPRGEDFHLHVEIYPRITRHAGFELGNDMFINTLPPEDYAESFRRLSP